MADNSADSPASASSPGSNTPGNLRNVDSTTTKTAKDKPCPFCHQPFTSSSLGRHLDLYIKPKNPKPADGVHDLEQIKVMRQGITRRQPRTSLRARQEKEDGVTDAQDSNAQSRKWHVDDSQDGSRSFGRTRQLTGGSTDIVGGLTAKEGVQTMLNTPNWQGTGVINDIPSRAPEPQSSVATPSVHPHERAIEKDVVGHEAEELELGRAAQYALREVLDSIEAAKERDSKFNMFDIDFFSMTFPSLCLEILPKPPTLFSMSPFGTSDSWSLEPPSQIQYDALHARVAHGVEQERDRLGTIKLKTIFGHLETTYENWSALPTQVQSEMWKLEVLRAFAKAKEAKELKDRELGFARQQIEHLRAQFDLVSKGQLPREMLTQPPETLSLLTEISRELTVRNLETRTWTYDRLVRKWKGAVRAMNTNGNGNGTLPGRDAGTRVSSAMPSPSVKTMSIPRPLGSATRKTYFPPVSAQGPPSRFLFDDSMAERVLEVERTTSRPQSVGTPQQGTRPDRDQYQHERGGSKGDDSDGEEDADAMDEEFEAGQGNDRSEAISGSRDAMLKRKLPPLENGTVDERARAHGFAKAARISY